jgi:thiol-disulfide isomerase/thioredoxin
MLGRGNQYPMRVRNDVDKNAAGFLKAIDQQRSAETSFLNDHKRGLPESFVAYWNAYYQYYNYFLAEQYPQAHQIFIKRHYTDTIPDSNYAVVKTLPYAFGDSLLQVPSYLLYLTGVLDAKLKAAGYTWNIKDTTETHKAIDSLYKLAYALMPTGSAEYYIAQSLYGRAKYQSINKTRAYFDTYKKHWPASEYMPMVERQVELAERLSPGMPAPDIDIVTADGKTVKLSDLKGKVVMLHFWASWCRQCVGEMIAEKKAKDFLKNKPVEFVYLCMDKDTTMPEMLLRKYKIEGLSGYIQGEWAATEIQLYGVQSLPGYFLIDKEGKFAVQNLPSPTQTTELLIAIGKVY